MGYMQIENLIVVSDFGYVNGGNSKVAIQTALAVKNDGLNVCFFCGAGPTDGKLIEKSVKVVCLQQQDFYEGDSRIKGFFQGIWNIRAKKKFYYSYKDFDKDKTAVHFHGWSRVLSPSVIYIASRMGFRIFFTLHDYNLLCPNGSLFVFPKNEVCCYQPLSGRCILCNCDRRKYIHKLYRILRFLSQKYALKNIGMCNLITISHQNDTICKEYYGKGKRIKLIYNPTDTDLPARVKVENNDTFMFIGRISDEKGIRLFCEAVTMGGYSGIVLGDGYLAKELKNKYENIAFMGWCKKEDVIRYIQKVRALVFPSLWYEGAPLVIMEMMQYGIPCIVSDISSAVEKVDDGRNGYIFKSNDVGALMQAMNKIMENRHLEQFSINAQNSFMQNSVSMEMYANELLNFIQYE